jgi:hypothetical protein
MTHQRLRTSCFQPSSKAADRQSKVKQVGIEGQVSRQCVVLYTYRYTSAGARNIPGVNVSVNRV